MADEGMGNIGVLNLEIHDNSKDAGEGLEKLAGALVRIKNAIGDSLGLDTVNKDLHTFATTVNKQPVTQRIIKSVTEFGNALDKLSKIKSIVNFDTQPISDLKTAIGNGIEFKITKTAATNLELIKTAMSGEWNTSATESAMKMLKERADAFSKGNTADKLQKMAKAIGDYAKAYAKMPSGTGPLNDTISRINNIVPGRKSLIPTKIQQFGGFEIKDYEENIKRLKAEMDAANSILKNPNRRGMHYVVDVAQARDILNTNPGEIQKYQDKIDELKGKIQSVEGVTKEATKPIEEAKNKIEETVQGLKNVESTIQESKDASAELKTELSDAGKVIEEKIEPVLENVSNKIKETVSNVASTGKDAIPAMDKDGPFKSASEELGHYTELLNKSKADMQFWSDKYEETLKRIKYNGATEETTNMLKASENSFYDAVAKVEEYEAALKRVKDYIDSNLSANSGIAVTESKIQSPVAAVKENIKESTESTKELENRLRNIVGIAEAWRSSTKEEKETLSHIFNNKKDTLVAGVIDKLGGMKGKAVDEFVAKIKEITDQSIEATEKVKKLFELLNGGSASGNVTMQVSESVQKINDSVGQTEKVVEAVKQEAEKIKEVQETVQRNAGNTSPIRPVNSASVDELRSSDSKEFLPADAFIDSYSRIDYLKEKLKELKAEFDDGRKKKILNPDEIDEYVNKITKLKEELRSLEDEQRKIRSLGDVFKPMKDGIKRAFPSLSGLIKRFGQIAKYRMLRSVLKHITSGFTEGVQNVYQYSKIVGTDLAPAMDSAATAMQQFKNSIGAAAAPLIQAFIPTLRQVISVAIEGINYLNQFFALINGQKTWTRALPEAAEAYGKTAKNAKAAGKAAKDLLASWDELNIISSQSGSGAGTIGGHTQEEYKNMFEEVGEFNQSVRDVVDYINEHLGGLPGLLKKAGIVLLGWKFSKAFGGALNSLQSILLEGAAFVIGLQVTYEGAKQAGLNGGFDATTLLTTAGGALATTVSGALIGFHVGGPWGALVGGATGLVLSLATAVKAYYDGDRTRRLREKWGKVHLTQDEINELVDGQVTAPVLLGLEIAKTSIENRADAKREADLKILAFSHSLKAAKFQLNADGSKDGIDAALESAKEAITAIQNRLTSEKEGLKLSFTKFTYRDKNGNDITEELFSSLNSANSELYKYFTGIGDQISEYIAKGYSEGLSDEEAKMALDLMTTFDNIMNKATENYEKNKLMREIEEEMKNNNAYDAETAQGILDRQTQRLQEYKDTTRDQLKQDLEGNYFTLEKLKAIKEDFETKYKNTGDTKYEKEINKYNGFIESTLVAIDNLKRKVSEIENGTYDWSQDSDYSDIENKIRTMWIEELKKLVDSNYLFSLIDKDIESNFTNNPIADVIMKQFNITPQELLGDEDRKKYIDYLSKKGSNVDQFRDSIMETLFKALLDNNGKVSKERMDEILSGLKTNYGEETVEKVYNDTMNSIVKTYQDMIDDMKSETMTADQFFEKWGNKKDSVFTSGYAFIADMFLRMFEGSWPEIKEKINNSIPEDDVNIWDLTGRRRLDPTKFSASGGVASGVRWVGENRYEQSTATQQAANKESIASDVSSGVKSGNEEQNGLLNTLISICRAISQKPFVVNLTPNSDWGRHNARSNEYAEKISGDYYGG